MQEIIYDDIIAVTEKAEYTTKSAIFILTGAQSRVTRGGQSITGTKFTLHRLDERLTVESDAENRVKAVIESPPKAD